MKKILLVGILVTAMTLPGCNLVVPREQYETLQEENGGLLEQIEQLNGQVQELEAQNTALEEKLAERREQGVTDPFDEKVLGSLFLRPDLIPVGGEDMRYYTGQCRVLGEQYVYAYAENGREAADMILSYQLQDDGAYEWALEAYDGGGGWEIPARSGETDTTGTVPAPVEPPAEQEAGSDASSSSASETGSSSEDGREAASSPASSSAAEQQGASSAPAVGVPVPNEAQQQKFREIASLLG